MRSNERSHPIKRVNSPDDCADSVCDTLPSADLEELVEQLRADAMHLADRYPANRPQTMSVRRRGKLEFSKPLVGVAAALLIAAGLWAAWISASSRVADTDFAGVAAAAPDETRSEIPAPRFQPTINTATAPEILPTMSFRDLTAAEQEALLDLLDDDQHVARLSI